ncbi:MAG: hypothetical protein CK520_01100 [Actinobacteria bacterium]|uniref:Unannotated protein n=1 Tax=freshwater metagenome TaxID=449393 RepID=A0A6J6RHL3_9ZZZZ|nr:hypothetical protein [Actinomycetota bacterium]MSO17371.1 hypothetical protein [Acidimicrobiia bacterium]GDX30605.1 hypothetical protein LBMAG14_10810 [Actinomycetes bacterium]MSV94899.1 hypothetical protein [Actinomycetota bacterium]MSW61341.1 hypothetical protein [Actinomycetota bacterium]
MLGHLLAISTLGWVLRVLVAAAVAIFIYAVGASTLRKFRIAPDEQPDPAAVVPVSLRFSCSVCGSEVTMTSAQAGEAPDAPRHCREDMVPVD